MDHDSSVFGVVPFVTTAAITRRGLHLHLGVFVILLSPLAPQFGQSKRIGFHLIVESRYARNHILKFQVEFDVAEEEPYGPFQGLIQRYCQGASATTLLDSSTQEPTGRTQEVCPSISISISPNS